MEVEVEVEVVVMVVRTRHLRSYPNSSGQAGQCTCVNGHRFCAHQPHHSHMQDKAFPSHQRKSKIEDLRLKKHSLPVGGRGRRGRVQLALLALYPSCPSCQASAERRTQPLHGGLPGRVREECGGTSA